jgi:hypothetical protein
VALFHRCKRIEIGLVWVDGKMEKAGVATRPAASSPSNGNFVEARYNNAGKAQHRVVSEDKITSDMGRL